MATAPVPTPPLAAASPPHVAGRKAKKSKIAVGSNWARLRDAAAVADVAAGRKRPAHLKPRRRLVAPPPRGVPESPSGGGVGRRNGAGDGRVGCDGSAGVAEKGVPAGERAGGGSGETSRALPAKRRRVGDTANAEAAETRFPPSRAAAAAAEALPSPPSMVTELESIKTTSHILAMDCEMVGVGPGGKESVLARVSIVDARGGIVLDTHVVVEEPVTDYRTWVSGILPHHVAASSTTANTYAATQQFVADLIKGRILVGHALHNDMNSLMLDHPRRMTRDTSLWYKKHGHGGRKVVGGRRTPPALRKLATTVLGLEGFQKGEHDSVGDARVTLALYKKSSKRWETELRDRRRA